MGKNDRLVIHTPGGGAWGAPKHDAEKDDAGPGHRPQWASRGSLAEREALQAGF